MRVRRLTDLARGLAVLAAGLGAGCAQQAPPAPLTHVDRVVEDVTAIIEGMVQAHSGPRGIAQLPVSHSPAPHS